MFNLKFYFMTILLSIALGVVGQEICDNGIDDDANGLIDLNDDQCDCGETRPLVAITGSVCNATLKLIATESNGISYQWYYNGVAILGETNGLLRLNQFDPEGIYICVVTTATGCYDTEEYLMEIPETEFIDLGIVYICPPECYTTAEGFTLCTPGDFSWDGSDAVTGCPYEVNVEVRVGFETSSTINDAICSGQTYELYDIVATESGVYQTVIPNWYGCDSIITVNLAVEPEIPVSIDVSICSGDTYEYLGINATTAGQYQTLISGNGDCDTLLTINLSVLEPVEGTLDASICAGATYILYDITATESGVYQTMLTSSEGCDSLLTVNLVILDPVEGTIDASICAGVTYTLYDISATESGVYQTMLTSTDGCDSLLNVNLTVDDPLSSEIDARVCAGDTYTLNDITATETGSYSTTIATAEGCDSMITVQLTVDQPIIEAVGMSFCEGETFIYYDINTTIPGQYETVFPAANGCDSTVVVNLEMLNNTSALLTEYICEGDTYLLYDISATESGIYTHTLTNAIGCDSIITVDLTVNDTVIVNLIEEICNGETLTVRDTEFTQTGMYDIVITDDFGCDTLINIDLTVLSESYATLNEMICQGESFTYGNIDTDFAGTYETILINTVGCDSIVTVNLGVNEHSEFAFTEEICEGETFTYLGLSTDMEGTYEVIIENAAGCDSTIAVQVIVNPLLRREVEITLCEGEVFSGYGLNADSTDIYEVRFSNTIGCDSIVTIDLLINAPEDLLELGEDMRIDLGEIISIIPEYIADDLTDLVWYDEYGNQLGFDRELTEYKPLVDTRVFLSGSDSNGCDVVDDILIIVKLNVEIYVPNIFSPNADGTNDEFLFKYNEGIIGIQEVFIFDRWGEHIYTADAQFTSEAYMGWDGTFKGEKVNPGVYVYMILANIIDGSTRSFSGDVTVVR